MSFYWHIANAQPEKDKATVANRAERSSRVLKQFLSLGKDSVPMDIMRRAKAIAVFSEINQVQFFLNNMSAGRGILTVRNGDDWSTPTFLVFKSGGVAFTLASKKVFDAVFLFMDDRSIGLLKKGDIKPGKVVGKKFALGPIVKGAGADIVTENASIIYYTFQNGQVSGQEFQSDEWFNSAGIFHDNKMNKSIYHKKAQTILTEAPIATGISPQMTSYLDLVKETCK